ncbi:MAG: putative manganese transporter [Paracoccaceae bacterium]
MLNLNLESRSMNWAPQNYFNSRIALVIVLAALALYPSEIGKITLTSLEDAYLGVSVFVAFTLLVFYGAEQLFKIDLRQSMRKNKNLQVPLSSFLGALPGCGGAVIVITAHNSGSVTLGAVVAALTSTMGDAAFLLIAKKPDTALFLLPMCWLAGIICGYLVDFFYKSKFHKIEAGSLTIKRILKSNFQYRLYIILFFPGFIFGIMRLSFIEISESFTFLSSIIAQCGIFLGLIIWSISPVKHMTHPEDSAQIRATEETCFISTWVILAFLTFEYTIYGTGLDLANLFQSVAWLLPLLAVLIGLIPGCGPQILVTTMYINGLIPFSALLGNAISNDGDALFPALAISPKIAVVATLLSTIPALILSYCFYFLAPSFLS